MDTVSIPIAFVAGLISFFAPCVLPLLPAYVGYVTGVSVKTKQAHRILFVSLVYIAGFSFVFTLLGAGVGGLGASLRAHTRLIQTIGGVLILVFGLEYLQVIKLGFLSYEYHPKLPKWAENSEYVRSFVLGTIFAITWTPCVGAVLGSILSLASVSGSFMKGASLLFVYALGISLPFLLVSFFLSSVSQHLRKAQKYLLLLSKLAGVLLVLLGLLLITDTYKYVNSWVFDFAFSLGYEIR